MKVLKRSDLILLVALAFMAFGKRRKRKAQFPPGKKHGQPGGGHTIPKRIWNFGALRELAQSVGVKDSELDTAAAIALAETAPPGNQDSVGDRGRSIGLWQINLDSCPKAYADAGRLRHDAVFNAQAMAAMSNRGENWSPWSTYKSGRYKQFLPK